MKRFKRIVVSPLYYLGKGNVHHYMNLEKDDTLVVYDEISPLPSISDRIGHLHNSLDLPNNAFIIDEVVINDSSEDWLMAITSAINNIVKDKREDYVVTFMPTDEDAMLANDKWYDECDLYFTQHMLLEDIDLIEDNLHEVYRARFFDYFKSFILNDFEQEESTLHVTYKVVVEDIDMLILVRNYQDNKVSYDSQLVDMDLTQFINNFDKWSLKGIPFKKLGTIKISNNRVDVVVELDGSKEYADIVAKLATRQIGTHLNANQEYVVVFPNQTQSSQVAWLRYLSNLEEVSEE